MARDPSQPPRGMTSSCAPPPRSLVQEKGIACAFRRRQEAPLRRAFRAACAVRAAPAMTGFRPILSGPPHLKLLPVWYQSRPRQYYPRKTKCEAGAGRKEVWISMTRLSPPRTRGAHPLEPQQNAATRISHSTTWTWKIITWPGRFNAAPKTEARIRRKATHTLRCPRRLPILGLKLLDNGRASAPQQRRQL